MNRSGFIHEFATNSGLGNIQPEIIDRPGGGGGVPVLQKSKPEVQPVIDHPGGTHEKQTLHTTEAPVTEQKETAVNDTKPFSLQQRNMLILAGAGLVSIFIIYKIFSHE